MRTRVEQLKDRGVRADAERQRQNRDDREAGVQPQQPRAVAQIPPGGLEQLIVFI